MTLPLNATWLPNLLILLLVIALPASARECSPDTVDIITAARPISFNVEVARTPEQQAQGLMFRPSMDKNAGMLFPMIPVRKASFWMRNTMISLDLIFIDAAGVIESIAPDAVPFSERVMRSQHPVRAVLEINGGLSAQLGIMPGMQVVHPIFDEAEPEFRCSS